jgi:hypothetical protein
VIERDPDPGTGRRVREWHSGFGTRREAEDARVRILADLQRGEHVPAMLTRLYAELGESLAPRTVQRCPHGLETGFGRWRGLATPSPQSRRPRQAAIIATVSDMPPRTWSARQLDEFLAFVREDRLYGNAVDLDAGRLAITRTLIEG